MALKFIQRSLGKNKKEMYDSLPSLEMILFLKNKENRKVPGNAL